VSSFFEEDGSVIHIRQAVVFAKGNDEEIPRVSG
jgi:hypothetical protein